jgi:hypothetical protein
MSQSPSITTQSDAVGGVDGVKSGGWGFHTSNDKEPWWQVDLGKVMPLDRVLIFNSHLPERASRLKVLLSPDGKSWREVYAHDGTPLPGASKPLSVSLKGAPGRFARIQLPGPQWLHLDEVEVYGQADPARNVALHQPANQSSTSQWSAAKLQPRQEMVGRFPIDKVLQRGRSLVERRRREHLDVSPIQATLDEVAAKLKALPAAAAADAERPLYMQARSAVRRLMLADPLLGFDKLLFVRRLHSGRAAADVRLAPQPPDGSAAQRPVQVRLDASGVRPPGDLDRRQRAVLRHLRRQEESALEGRPAVPPQSQSNGDESILTRESGA